MREIPRRDDNGGRDGERGSAAPVGHPCPRRRRRRSEAIGERSRVDRERDRNGDGDAQRR